MLTQSDRARIEAAIKAAEAGTTGEIYCVVAGESSDYRETPLAWVIAALGAPAGCWRRVSTSPRPTISAAAGPRRR